MPKATTMTGRLNVIEDCYLEIDGTKIEFRILPVLSDGKGAAYNDEPVIGRSFPIKTYSHSKNRVIGIKFHFIVIEDSDIQQNLSNKRLIESCTYPRDGSPYTPPVICKIKIGKLLGDEALCAVMTNYRTNYPDNVAWDESTLLPYYFTMDLTFDTTYNHSDLPNQSRIAQTGR